MLPVTGPDGIECYQISHESGASALLARHGGHLLSWKTADGTERLFLSETAEYGAGKAIRGGVPVIFPQFSDHGPYSRHGFARKLKWESSPESDKMIFTSNETTRADWPFDFEIKLQVELSSDSLQLTLQVKNTGSVEFPFQAALHTYFRTGTVEQTRIEGLAGANYLNALTKEIETDTAESIHPGVEIDRAYFSEGQRTVQLDSGNGTLQIQSEGFTDIVVWNPGPDHGIGDLPEDGWTDFFCVESALIENGPILQPGKVWTGSQKIVVR